MPPRTGPFAGGPLIRQAAQRFSNREERDLAEELRRLRVREGQARFRRDFDFRPEGSQLEVPEGPTSEAPEERPAPTRGDRGDRSVSDIISGARPAGGERPAGGVDPMEVDPGRFRRELAGGTPSDASARSGTSLADELKTFRTQGGTELMPGDVREEEALDRTASRLAAASMPSPGERRPATMDAALAEDRIEMPGGGSVSREPPEVRRMREMSSGLADAFDVPEERAFAAVQANMPELLREEEAEETDFIDSPSGQMLTRMFLESPDADPGRIQERTGATFGQIRDARSAAQDIAPDRFEDQEDPDEPDFLNTEEGTSAFEMFRSNPSRDPVEVARAVGTENLRGVLTARQEAMDADQDAEDQPEWMDDQRISAVANIIGTEPFNEDEAEVYRMVADSGGVEPLRTHIEDARQALANNPDASNRVERTRTLNQWERALDNITGRVSQGDIQALSDMSDAELLLRIE